MRTTFISFLLCALSLLAARAQQTLPTLDDFQTKAATLEGRITDYPAEGSPTSGLIYLKDVVTLEDYPKAVTIRPDGTFRCQLPLSHPVASILVIGDNYLPFYAEPGGRLSMEFALGDGGGWDWAGRIRYEGHEAQTAQQLADHEMPAFGYREMRYGAENLQPLEMRDYMLQKLRDALARVDSLRTTVPLTGKAARQMEYELRLRTGEVLFDYVREVVPSHDTKAHREQIPAAFYDFLREMPLDEADALAAPSYDTFVNRLEFSFLGYFRWGKIIIRKEAGKEEHFEEARRLLHHMERVDSTLRANNGIDLPATLVGRLARLHHAPFTNFEDDEAGRYLRDGILPASAEKRLRQALEEKYLAKCNPQSLRPQPLPDGPGADIMRRLLAPHRGRYVLVDFWDTTCGPCRQGIELSTEVRQQLKDSPDITFLYVTGTADSPDEKSYNDYVTAHMLGYPHHRLPQGKYNYLRELFRFNGIPHYVVFDRQGRLVSGDYGFLSGSTLEHDLKKWMEQEGQEQ